MANDNQLHLNAIVEKLAQSTRLDPQVAGDYIHALTQIIGETLAQGEEIEIGGIGVFRKSDETSYVEFEPCNRLAQLANAPFETFEPVVLEEDYPVETEGADTSTTHTESKPFAPEPKEATISEPESEPVAAFETEPETITTENNTLQHTEMESSSKTSSSKIFTLLFIAGLLTGICMGFIAGFLLRPVIIPSTCAHAPTETVEAPVQQPATEMAAPTQPEPEVEKPQAPAPSEKSAVVLDTVKPGTFLTTLSRKHYGGRYEFWIYIYEENKDKIADPQNVPVGTVLVIPPRAKYGINPGSSASISMAKERLRLYETKGE